MPIYLVLSEVAKVEFKEGTVLELMKEVVGWFENVANNLLRRWGGYREILWRISWQEWWLISCGRKEEELIKGESNISKLGDRVINITDKNRKSEGELVWEKANTCFYTSRFCCDDIKQGILTQPGAEMGQGSQMRCNWQLHTILINFLEAWK